MESQRLLHVRNRRLGLLIREDEVEDTWGELFLTTCEWANDKRDWGKERVK